MVMAEEKKEDKFQEIETERLHLRKIHDEDTSMLFKTFIIILNGINIIINYRFRILKSINN